MIKPITPPVFNPDIAGEIILTAIQYLGMKEIDGNSGFVDAEFEKRMKKIGWQKGQAWCAYFTELVWREAYAKFTDRSNELDKLFNGGAVNTYTRFSNDKRFTCNQTPVPGAIVIWQQYKGGKPSWQGHAGIVNTAIDDVKFPSIEGNTNSQGGREGIEVSAKTRRLLFSVNDGLRIKGFIHPIKPELL